MVQLLSTRSGVIRPAATPAGRRLSVRVTAAKQLQNDRTTVKKNGESAAQATNDVGTAGLAAIALGLPASGITLWSEYTLFTTGAGLPPGPGGALGAAEGLSYLVVIGIIGWSAATKASTGSGLPAGPAGLLGAVEGVSYLALLGGIIAFGAQIVKTGGLPGIFG
ncbi:hypothetical protein MNEG_10028 [Monoraphidium neglectum]|uniref:Uncharacterized protein n=1 Tax=Monoraphidium neglectum TaxID=145388 RepID=A0A0D2MAG3_9CHLO|nr:hypothetical protein MNEG_10028 [Monoraphidium neglectum]KIY97936.1 hypothetical protein MNEG_10028 [Monoraphidium neglectum]|eukprot:XP_013896956.1 hypothetical protein MNEG_10028 [Monoraphidium neglectum]